MATLARQRGRFGLGTFWNEDATSGSREARDQRRDRYVTSDATDSDSAGIDSGERSDACRAERSQLRSRKRALREQATPVWRAGHDPGGRPGDWASDNLPRRSRPARCRSRPAQGHGPRSQRSRRRSRHSRRRSQRRRAVSGSGIHVGAGRRSSGFHQGGRVGQKQSIITSLTQLYLTWRGSRCCGEYICYVRCVSRVPISRLGTPSGILAQPDSVSESLPGPSLASACAALPALP